MKAKYHFILYTFLGMAVVLSVLLAADYGLRADRSASALEDSYAQRLLEAQEHLQSIAVKLNKAPAASAPATQVELLATVSRQADGVVSDLTALPLSHVAMSDTIRFCNQLSEYSLAQALLTASGQPLGEAALHQLAMMENQCQLLLGQFATARAEMVSQSLRMTSDESAFYQPAQLSLRPLEQVADPDNGMDYPSMIYDGAFSDAPRTGEPKALPDGVIDQAQAIGIARKFIGEQRVQSAEESVPTGGAIPCFGVKFTLHDGTVLNADITRQGGQVLWMIPEHAAFAPSLTLEECEQSALRFLRTRGYGEMEAGHYQVYDGLAVIHFIAVQDGVLLYPDQIKLQLRMDTGEVVGMESSGYLMNHVKRTELTPILSEDEARKLVSGRLEITASRLCVIPQNQAERLCWEFCGAYEDNEYRVYIDAQTGEEADVLMMIHQDGAEMAA